jgi:hypothetical protein
MLKGKSLNQSFIVKLNFFWRWHLVAMPVFLVTEHLFIRILEEKNVWSKNNIEGFFSHKTTKRSWKNKILYILKAMS